MWKSLFHEGLSASCSLLSYMQVCSTRPGCHSVESRGCRLPFEERPKHLELLSSTLFLVCHWFSVKGSEQNTRRASVPTEGEIHFTLPEPAKTQIPHSEAAVYVTSVINWNREVHLVGKSAQFSQFLHERNTYDQPGSEGQWSPKIATHPKVEVMMALKHEGKYRNIKHDSKHGDTCFS